MIQRSKKEARVKPIPSLHNQTNQLSDINLRYIQITSYIYGRKTNNMEESQNEKLKAIHDLMGEQIEKMKMIIEYSGSIDKVLLYDCKDTIDFCKN
jgi:hypothetical protein